MRKVLFFSLIAILSGNAISQNLNFASHTNLDVLSKAVCINSKSFYIEKIDGTLIFNGSGALTHFSPDSANIVGVNAMAQVLFKKQFIKTSAHQIVSLKSTNDMCLAFVGYSWGCDVGPRKCYFVKIDTLGNEIFNFYIPNMNGISYTLTIKDFTQHTDSSYYMVSDSVVFHLSKSGVYLSKMNTGMTGIKSISCLPSGNLLLAGNSTNIPVLVELSTLNSIVNQQSSLEPLKKIRIASSGNIFGLTESGYLRSYQSNLSALFCSSVTVGSNLKVYDFDIKMDTIYVSGYNSNTSQIFYAMFDSNLQLLYQSSFPYQYIKPSAITINSTNRVTIFSNCSSTNKTYSPFISIHQFPRYGNFSSKYDIGVSNVVLSNFAQTNNPILNCIYNFNVTVRNFGNDTIKGFKLNKFLFDGLLCDRYRYNKYYNMLILPHDSVVVSTSLFSDFAPSASPSFSKSICFFTSIPNSENDIETNNDEFCKTISFPVGISESSKPELDAFIFPNPFNSMFTIVSPNDIQKVKVFNALGEMVLSETSTGKELFMKMPDFSRGIYFVSIETEKGTVTKKLIKE